MKEPIALKYITVQYSTVNYSTLHVSMVQYNRVEYDKVQCRHPVSISDIWNKCYIVLTAVFSSKSSIRGGGVDKERSKMAGVKLKGVGFGWGICWAGVGLVRVLPPPSRTGTHHHPPPLPILKWASVSVFMFSCFFLSLKICLVVMNVGTSMAVRPFEYQPGKLDQFVCLFVYGILVYYIMRGCMIILIICKLQHNCNFINIINFSRGGGVLTAYTWIHSYILLSELHQLQSLIMSSILHQMLTSRPFLETDWSSLSNGTIFFSELFLKKVQKLIFLPPKIKKKYLCHKFVKIFTLFRGILGTW